jgi:formylglycine-generating enzyme required for sulfatase activity
LIDAALAAAPDLEEARQLATEIAERRAIPEGFVYVPAGAYPVGSGDEPDNAPRVVPLAAFAVGATEVTNAQYAAFVDGGGYTDARWWEADAAAARAAYLDRTGKPGPRGWSEGRFPAGTGDQPVTGVAWAEAAAYAKFAGGRLPTEEEWEVAAGFDPSTAAAAVYPWGTAWDPSRVGLPGAKTWGLSPVGRRPGDRSPLGCTDMAGNALEWTLTSTTDGSRVVRGGSPLVRDPERECRVAHRGFRAGAWNVRLALIGFRLVRAPGGEGR